MFSEQLMSTGWRKRPAIVEKEERIDYRQLVFICNWLKHIQTASALSSTTARSHQLSSYLTALKRHITGRLQPNLAQLAITAINAQLFHLENRFGSVELVLKTRMSLKNLP
jgi:hypothetical protein